MPPKRKHVKVESTPPPKDNVEQPIEIVPELEIFSKKDMQISVIDSKECTILPLNAFTDNSPITFKTSKNASLWLDPRSFFVTTVVSIHNSDGSKLAADSNTAPIANFAGVIVYRNLYKHHSHT